MYTTIKSRQVCDDCGGCERCQQLRGLSGLGSASPGVGGALLLTLAAFGGLAFLAARTGLQNRRDRRWAA